MYEITKQRQRYCENQKHKHALQLLNVKKTFGTCVHIHLRLRRYDIEKYYS